MKTGSQLFAMGQDAYIKGLPCDSEKPMDWKRGWFREHYDCIEVTGRKRPPAPSMVPA